MIIRNLLKCAALVLLSVLPLSQANAQTASDTQHFVITEGKFTVQPVFCIPELCQTQEGEFSGSFDATFFRDEIRLSNIDIKSQIDFTLPKDPYTDVNGAIYDARYYFDGRTLILEGSINSSAFDGPIVHYALTAELGEKSTGFDPMGHYLARQDYRKCAAPMCGGIYVKSVNARRLTCPDGRARQECYIGSPDWDLLGFNPFAELNSPQLNNEILLKGIITDDMDFGRFTAEKAYASAGKAKPRGIFFGVESNGIVCISSPCFSFDEYVLNKKRQPQAISDIDLSRTGASEKQVDTAFQLMAERKAVIVVGENRRYRGFSGTGLRLVASQFYLPIQPATSGECPEGYTKGELGCETRNGCLYPLLEQAVYGGAPPQDGEAPMVSYECVTQCEEPAISTGSGYCALYLP